MELIADNKDGALAPGAFARVHFQIPPDRNAMTLPADALLFRDSAPEVATVGLDNRIVLKKVRIARDLGSKIEITGGLSRDERIVANPPNSIGEGEEVQVMEAAGEKMPRPSARQRAEGPKDHPKSAEEMAQTAGSRGMKWRTWLAAPIALALGGCDFAPRYAPPSVATPSKFRDEVAGATLPASGDWWLAFHDRTLNELQGQVDAANPDLAAAVAANDVAVARANAALSASYPQVDAVPHFLANKQSANRPLRSANQPTYYGDNLIGAQTAYEVDIWGRVRDLVESANLTPRRVRTRSPTPDSSCMRSLPATTSICAVSTTGEASFRYDRDLSLGVEADPGPP